MEGLPRLAEQLEWLIDHIPGPDGRRYTSARLADEVRRHGASVSASYIGHMRQGRTKDIGAARLAAVARAFDVPLDFFVNPDLERRLRADIENLTEVRDRSLAEFRDTAVDGALRTIAERRRST